MDKTSINTNVKEFSDVQRALETIKSELDKLKEKSEVIPEEVEDETVGQVGSIRIIKNSDTESLFEIKDNEGWKKPMMGESQITLKKLTSNIKVVEKKSIDELETEDTNTDSDTAKKTIFDEKADKFVMARPDYTSGWVNLTDQDTTGTHPLETVPLFGIYQFSINAGTTVQSGTMGSQAGEHAILEVTSTAWKIIGTDYYGFWGNGSGDYDRINYTGWTGGDSGEDTTNATIQIRVLLWK